MKPSLETRLLWLFRIAVCMEYVGHGAFGILTKKAWVPYFGVVGIPEAWAWKLMPIVGSLDIALGLLVLVWPTRAALLYMAAWGLWTALLRPLSGEPVWEAIERAGNYGVPLAFFLAGEARGWWTRVRVRPLEGSWTPRLAWLLRLTTCALLAGHGALASLQKPMLAKHLAGIGLSTLPLPALGGFELALALVVLLAPAPGVLLFVFGWKVATELLFPLTGAPWWEFIERGGSYVAPLALWWLTPAGTSVRIRHDAAIAVPEANSLA